MGLDLLAEWFERRVPTHALGVLAQCAAPGMSNSEDSRTNLDKKNGSVTVGHALPTDPADGSRHFSQFGETPIQQPLSYWESVADAAATIKNRLYPSKEGATPTDQSQTDYQARADYDANTHDTTYASMPACPDHEIAKPEVLLQYLGKPPGGPKSNHFQAS
ncbi:hypothetical protein Bbelb_070940 [Branchiostoma belcheri]|nr:hypothetical protein Bbelb_070940 [Branchiostoma belcheri]